MAVRPTSRRGFTIGLKRLKPRAPNFGGPQPALVTKCCLAASIVTCKLVLSVGRDFFLLLVRNVTTYLRSLTTDVYLGNYITKPCHVGHSPFHCLAVIATFLSSMVISLNTFFQYSTAIAKLFNCFG